MVRDERADSRVTRERPLAVRRSAGLRFGRSTRALVCQSMPPAINGGWVCRRSLHGTTLKARVPPSVATTHIKALLPMDPSVRTYVYLRASGSGTFMLHVPVTTARQCCRCFSKETPYCTQGRHGSCSATRGMHVATAWPAGKGRNLFNKETHVSSIISWSVLHFNMLTNEIFLVQHHDIDKARNLKLILLLQAFDQLSRFKINFCKRK
jgi:hypothetical protein